MTVEEKLERLLNPSCVEDYGLGISFSELMSFEQGRIWTAIFFLAYVPFQKWPDEIKNFETDETINLKEEQALFEKMGSQARDTIDNIILGVIGGERDK